MKHHIYLSVVIPCYNEEKLLPKCLKAVCYQQTIAQDLFEVIVVDNNSTDDSIKKAMQFPVRIVSEKQQGIVAARNKGYLEAKGKIIVNLDADSAPNSDWLQRIYDHFVNDPNLVFLTGPYKTKQQDPLNEHVDKINTFLQKYTKHIICYWGGNFMVRKSTLKAIGGYDLRFPNADQLSLITIFKQKGRVFHDSRLSIWSSDRRTQGRTLSFVVEVATYFLNMLTIKWFNKDILIWKPIR